MIERDTTVHDRDLAVSRPDLTLKGRDPATTSPDQPVNSSNDEMNDEMDGLHERRLAAQAVNDGRTRPGVQDEDADRGGPPRDPDQRLSGPDDRMEAAPTVVLSVRGGGMPSVRARIQDDWPAEDFGTGERRPDASIGLASLGFIRAALRRRARVWCVIALVGLLAGTGYLKERPPAQAATVTLLVASPPNSTAGQAIADDQAYVQSLPIAVQALRQLNLHEPPTVFLRHYAATVVTNSVLTITVKATSSADAVSEANALARAFLSFQKNLLTTQTQLVNAQYSRAIAQARTEREGTEHRDQQPVIEARLAHNNGPAEHLEERARSGDQPADDHHSDASWR